MLTVERVAHGARYCDARCRAAAFRARNGYLPLSAGGPRPVRAEGRANASRGKPSGRQVSFRRAVNVLAAELAQLRRFGFAQLCDETEGEWAERVLAGALSERQRDGRP